MSLSKQHEIHTRRGGRNLGVGLALGGFVVVILGLTFAKVQQDGFTVPAAPNEVQD